jgi:hypothetical protein
MVGVVWKDQVSSGGRKSLSEMTFGLKSGRNLGRSLPGLKPGSRD